MPEPTIADVLAAIAAMRSDVMDRIDRLQDAVGAIRDDIAVNFAAAERAVDRTRAFRDELESLGREVSGMQRQIQRLRSEMDDIRKPPQ